ncbi:MAG TPA: ATP-binding protein [Candidatus Sulfotelmatobacter sp.]|nr:ATP-binding protein [Candidatus Sulfotelmatobacter sp.]
MAKRPPVPADEERRLAALHEYELLDSPPEAVFDALTRVAQETCGAPVAQINLIDHARQWTKSWAGIESPEVPRDLSFCAHTVAGAGLLEVADTHEDARFVDHPFVTGGPEVRFYAGVPLRSSDGHAIGALCVADVKPRTLEPHQRAALEAIAAAVVQEFEARRTLLRLFDSSHTELYHVDLGSRHVVFASEAARRNLGYSLDELHALPLAQLLPALEADGELDARLRELHAAPDRRLTMRTTARRKDGSTYPIELRLELMHARGHEFAMAVATDLTEREQAQERINLLSTAIEAAHDPILITKPSADPDQSSTVVYANEAFLRQMGYPADRVLGRRVDTFFGARTDMVSIDAARHELLNGRPVRIEFISYRADGSTWHAEASVRPLPDEDGRTAYFVMVLRDVTEQVLRGVQLAMQNERLTAITSIARTLFASLEPTLLVEALLGGVRQLVDGRATLYVPGTRGGFVATSDLAPDHDTATGDPFVSLASRTDVAVLDEAEQRVAVRIVGSGGGTAYVLDVQRQTRFTTADVFALGLLGQYFGVAARNVELYQELAARRDAVVELNQVKNDLIAMLAHDFKGPLTTIVGFADVLADDDRFDAESRQYLGMISSSAMRLAALATDTLALSRLEQNELALTLDEVDFGAIVREVVRVLGVTRPIELRVQGDRLSVYGDASRLRQVIENLIGNAIKYSPGGEPVEVTVRARNKHVELAVRDRGIGIPENERAKLFGRFARASNARALGIAGTGFGLYLTKTIVDMHGGSIEVESAEGQGATFRVAIPTRAVTRAAPSLRLALLDTDGDARSYIAHTLRDDGAAVTVATSGEELLRVLAEGRFDAAVVDGDRLELQPGVFLRRAGARVPLIWLGLRFPAERGGWSAFLTKPFLMKDLYGAVRTSLDGTSHATSA